ncbi:MAG TPA: serine/threonine-protein kinase [Kofleriaceae bacterium]|nr:serine/threonine-protein kinase [Kofleriaceae bacterium]
MQPGEIVGGRWRILREAGHGGMGTVFRAAETKDETPVAIKVLRRTESLDDAIASGRFAREVELLSALDDPRIVRYVAHGVTPAGRPFLVEEWIEGSSLGEVLDADGLTAGETARVIAEVAAGLAVAHAHGIVHRDVKPDNVMFVGGDLARVKLIDFGIARRGDEAFPITRTGTFVGTPGYVSPEQARGSHTLDGRSDLFSLGCVLYQCLTGRPPFAGRTVTAVRAKVLLYEPPPVSVFAQIPDALEALVGKLLAKSALDRPADAQALADAIAPFVTLGGPRRPTHVTGQTHALPRGTSTDLDTLVTSDTREGGVLACVVIAEASGPVGASRLRAAIAGYGGRLEELFGQTVLVTASPTLLPSEQVVVAARCALAIRPMVAGPIVLSGVGDKPTTDTISIALDDGVNTLAKASAQPELEDRVIVERAFAAPLRDAGFAIDQDDRGTTFLRA